MIFVKGKPGKHHSLLNVSQLRIKIIVMCRTLVCITRFQKMNHPNLVELKFQPAYILRAWEEEAVNRVLGAQDRLRRYERLVRKN